MTKSYIKKAAFYLGLIYLTLALGAIAFNGFSFRKSVSRYKAGECSGSMVLNGNEFCVDTLEFRTDVYYDWARWSYFSNERGVDQVIYIPVDTLLIFTVTGALFTYTRIESRKRTSK